MTVDRYTNIDKSKGESESVSKNIFLSRYQENEIFLTKVQQHTHQSEIYEYIESWRWQLFTNNNKKQETSISYQTVIHQYI